MTAVTVDASSPAFVGGDTTTTTTASFTPRAGTLIVAVCAIGNSTGSGTVTGTVTDSLGSTWAMVRRLTNSTHGTVEIWAMDAGTSPAARTVTLTGSGTNGKGTAIAVQVLNNARPVAHLQMLGSYSSAVSGTGTNLTITAAATGSLAFHVLALAQSTTLTGPNAAATSVGQYNDATNAYTFGVTKNTAATVSTSAKSGGWTNTITSALGTHMLLEFPPVDSPMTFRNLYPSIDAATGVTAGSGTKRLAYLATQQNAGSIGTNSTKTTVNGPTAPLQYTDSTVSLSDGAALSWYTVPLAAGSIGAITVTCQFYGSETNSLANVAPVFKLERCSNDGTVLSTIVDNTGNQGGLEYATGVQGRAPAATATPTSWVDADRLRITFYIDDAAEQGGTGNMVTGYGSTAQYNAVAGATGSATLSSLAYLTEFLPTMLSASASGATTIAPATLSLEVVATDQSLVGSSSALTLSPGSGSCAGSGTPSLAGSAAALVLTKGTGSAVGAGAAALAGSAAALTLSSGSGAITPGSSALAGSASMLVLSPASGSLVPTGPGLVEGSAAVLSLSAGAGALAPTGTASVAGSAASLALSALSGALAPTGQGNALGSAGALVLSPGTGSAAGTGQGSAQGSAAALVLAAGTGSVASAGSVTAIGSAAALALSPGSGEAVGWGVAALEGSEASLVLDAGAGSLSPSGAALLDGSPGLLLLAAHGGSVRTQATFLIGSSAALTLTAVGGQLHYSGGAELLLEATRMSFTVPNVVPQGSAVSISTAPCRMVISVMAVQSRAEALWLSLDGASIPLVVQDAYAAVGDYQITVPLVLRFRVPGVGGDAFLWPVPIELVVPKVASHSGATLAVEPVRLSMRVQKIRSTGGTTAPFMRPVRLMVSSAQSDAGNLELAWPK